MQTITKIHKLAAFSMGQQGGNPAGVVVRAALPEEPAMQRIAAELGYSETVFAASIEGGWRVRYFAPENEVPFCGHATIALGAVLASLHGDGRFQLSTNVGPVTVEGKVSGPLYSAALQSPPTSSAPAPAALVEQALALFGYRAADLDPRIPPAIIEGGARHLLLALNSRERLAAMHYELDAGRALMRGAGCVTIMLLYADTPHRFHARNAFASGGVYEDPATGAAAAALAGYLRELDLLNGGQIEILQGEDMGMPSQLLALAGPQAGGSVRVSGMARVLLD